MRFVRLTALISIFLFVPLISAYAEETALKFVEVNVNKVIEILQSCQNDSNCTLERKRERLSQLADRLFDFRDISRRALGRNVRVFSDKELDRFVYLFSTMLKNYYITKIDNYSNEKVVFEKEVQLSQDKFQVNTLVVMSDKEIPIVYKLAKRDGTWKVYDVLIEGVSMVKNYRSQFSQILRRHKPAYVLKLLEKKVKNSVYK